MFGSFLGGALGGILQSNQNPFNSGFGSLTGGLFPAGINQLGDNYLNGYINYYYANKLANEQNQRQIDFWNMQNAYNTPAAQMARYQAAGLNPNLVYNQQNLSSPIGTAAVGSFSMPHNQLKTQGFDLVSALQTYYGIMNMKEQNSLLAAQAEFTSEQARRQKIDNAYLESNGLSSYSPTLVRELATVPPMLLNMAGIAYDFLMREIPGTKQNRFYNSRG